jgi:alginate biosynthesis protein AlgX
MRAKSVYRHPDQVKTGRFYMPMSGLWPEGAQAVDIVLDVPFAGSARVTACFD